jgi:hypothetical protein
MWQVGRLYESDAIKKACVEYQTRKFFLFSQKVVLLLIFKPGMHLRGWSFQGGLIHAVRRSSSLLVARLSTGRKAFSLSF